MLPPEGFLAPWTPIEKAHRFGRKDVNTNLVYLAVSFFYGKHVTLIKVIFKGIQTQKVGRAEIAVKSAIHQSVWTFHETGIRESQQSLPKITR